MKRLLLLTLSCVILMCVPILGMDGDKIAAVVHVAEIADNSIERLEQTRLGKLFLQAKDSLYASTAGFLENGFQEEESVDTALINLYETEEKREGLTVEERKKAHDKRVQLQEEALVRKRNWHGIGREIKAKGIDVAQDIQQLMVHAVKSSFVVDQQKLRELEVQGAAERDARVGVAREYIQAIKDNPKYLLGLVAALAFIVPTGIYVAKHGVESAFDYYKTPELLDPAFSSGKKGWFGNEEELSLSDVVLTPEVAERIRETVHGLKNASVHGGLLKNMLLHGEPGVGKTMLAKRIARSSGLKCVGFTASNLVAFSEEQAVKKLDDIIRSAKRSYEKVVVIIDEVEYLAGDRANPNSSNKVKALITKLLGDTGTESRDVMFIWITNRKGDLDPAFISRCDDQIYIAVPGPVERRALIQMYVDKYLIRGENLKPKDPPVMSFWFGDTSVLEMPRIEEGVFGPEELDVLTEKLEGFVGREIAQLMSRIQWSAMASDTNIITRSLIDRVVAVKLAERKTDEETLA